MAEFNTPYGDSPPEGAVYVRGQELWTFTGIVGWQLISTWTINESPSINYVNDPTSWETHSVREESMKIREEVFFWKQNRVRLEDGGY